MAWKKNKWKFAILVYLVFLNVFTKSLPIVGRTLSIPIIASTDQIVIQDNAYLQVEELSTENVLEDTTFTEDLGTTEAGEDVTIKIDTVDLQENVTSLLRNDPIRPGQIVTLYSIEITPNGLWQTFSGRAIIRVELQAATREDPIIFHAEGLNIQSVQFGLLSLGNPLPADFFVDDDLLQIQPPALSSTYIFLIQYTGSLRNDGSGLYQGFYGDTSYIAMNLYPTNARRVFPCMDEPSQESTISFTFIDIEHNFITGNSIVESTDNNQIEFTALQGPPHRWGFVAHNFVNIGIYPLINARLYVRAGIQSQDQVTSTIINAIFPRFEEWTNRQYSEIHQGQNDILDIFAMPDIVKEWHALSTICIWEPYILMPIQHGMTHRKTAIIEISKAISNQWFGYVIYPENWRYQWINTGLATHSAFEMAKAFQEDTFEGDNTVIDVNTVFVSEIMQESMFRDGYSNSRPLEPSEDLFDQEPIRDHVNGIIKYKAPAIMHMLKQTLGQTVADPNVDYVQAAARALLNVRSLQTFNSLNFYDAVNSEWIGAFNPLIDDLPVFMAPWVESANYPVVNVQTRINSIGLTQETFSYTNVPHVTFDIPITYTSRVNPDFDDLTPRSILGASDTIPITLGEDDWFLLNVQGQGYYRVNYDEIMWERIILALEDRDQRADIHPLNRATLVDDALNLARAGRLDYDIAFRVVLTMLHELEYPVWKAYVRNMDWIRKRLVAMVDDEDAGLDQDIYLRMVRRTIDSVEDEIGFHPDPLIIEDAMTSMTRGLVMEHACKANYAPCIAAAVDWFYDPDSNEPVVNQDILHDIRPAVFCTMMREGDVTARDALWERFDEETSHYERLVIVKAMACSSDQNYLNSFLNEAISGGGRLGVEEKFQFFIALIESSFANADLALRYIRINTRGIRNMFGGSDKLEEIITTLAENVVDDGMTENMDIWINSMNSNIDDSQDVAERAAAVAAENMIWNQVHMEFVYDWIDANDAHTVAVSFALMVICFMVNVFNQ